MERQAAPRRRLGRDGAELSAAETRRRNLANADQGTMIATEAVMDS